MPWFVKLFGCGRQPERISKQMQRAGQSEGGLVSEITQVGDYVADGPVLTVPILVAQPPADVTQVSISVSKLPGEKLGLKLYRASLQIQSFEPGTALWEFVQEVPVGSCIYSVNGQIASMVNIRGLLRNCRGAIVVELVFSKSNPAVRTISSHRLSYSSQSSTGLSPTPSQLSNMWRRASDTGSLPCQEGMTMIDFEKLSKDSMGMWTRKTSSLQGPAPDSFNAEYGESPTSWRRRKLEAKQRHFVDEEEEDKFLPYNREEDSSDGGLV